MGKIIAVCISEKKGTAKKSVQKGELIEGYGLVGDAHAGSGHRQISLLSHESIEAFRARGARVEDGAFGENLVVSGIDLTHLDIGTMLICAQARLRITQIGKQCHTPCAIYKSMGECIMPKEGVFAEVIRAGEIKPGDEIAVCGANYI